MFSHDIVSSDAFLEMPTSSRELYFQLGMNADDDGFVNPKKIMRIVSASEDDLKVLLAKRFLLSFESGVVVIKHWLVHNLLRKDRYTETRYLEEKKSLKIKENKAYSELWQPNGNQMVPQYRIEENRIEEKSIPKKTKKNKEKKPLKPRLDIKLIDFFFLLKGWDTKNKANRIIYGRYLRPAKQLLELTEGNLDTAKHNLQVIANWANAQKIDWSIETVFKRWHDIGQLPQEKEKKPFIEGRPAYKKGNRWYFIAVTGEHFEYVGETSKIIYQ